LSTKKSKLLENAQKNIQKGQYDRAIGEYEEIVKLDPDVRHRQKLAELLAKANRREEAIREYSSLAKHYEESVHYVKAIAVFKQIQKLDPTNPDVSITLATLNEKQGLIGNAIAEYNSALQIYEKNSENRKALKILDSLLALDPGNAAIRLRIAEKCFSIGDETRALNVFADLARDLKENEDENGYSRVAERMLALFPEKASELLAEMEETGEPEPALAVTAEASPLLEPEPEVEPSPPVSLPESPPLAPMEKPAVPAPAAPPETEEEIELIEDILEIDEFVDLEENSDTGAHEWEEEIDLGPAGLHDFGGIPAGEETIQEEFASTGHDFELEEIELEDIELELEIEPEAEAVPESALEAEAEVISEGDVEEELEELTEIEAEQIMEMADIGEPAAEEDLSVGSFDLAGELALFADELDFDLPRGDGGDAPFFANESAMFKTSDLDREDAESHYSLGLAYKEMGLYEEAIAEFDVASGSPGRRIDSLLLMALCHRENGDLASAEKQLTSVMQEPSISEDELLSVKYELAVCQELAGNTDAARRLFTEIITIRPGFSDTSTRLENL